MSGRCAPRRPESGRDPRPRSRRTSGRSLARGKGTRSVPGSRKHIDDRSLPECTVLGSGGAGVMRRARLTALLLSVLLAVGLLPATAAGATGSEPTPVTGSATVRGSVHQVHVIDAEPGTE